MGRMIVAAAVRLEIGKANERILYVAILILYQLGYFVGTW